MRVTISGLPGSGTTTVAKILAERLNCKLISAGEVFRKMAKDLGMSLEEFSKYARENPEIDKKLDKLQKELAEKENDVVVEGRLSGWFVNADLKVWIYCEDEERYKRVAKRENLSYEEAKRKTMERERIEKERYKKFYGINIDDLTIYDVAINSGRFKPEEIVEIILKAIELKNHGNKR